MNKKCLIILKGYELMQEIANGKIKYGTKFRDLTDSNYEDNSNIYRYENKNFIGRYGGTNILKLLNHDFEILEDEEEIDIQSIEETEIKNKDGAEYYEYYNGGYSESGYTKNYSLDDLQSRKIINQLIKAVKQLDKKINKED